MLMGKTAVEGWGSQKSLLIDTELSDWETEAERNHFDL